VLKFKNKFGNLRATLFSTVWVTKRQAGDWLDGYEEKKMKLTTAESGLRVESLQMSSKQLTKRTVVFKPERATPQIASVKHISVAGTCNVFTVAHCLKRRY
jgi:hypothetical protein